MTSPNIEAGSVDPGLLDDLTARGLIHDTTDRDELARRLAAGPISVYVGFDPSASSLHAGNLVGLLMLHRFQQAGHRPIVLSGGATGLVGDPSGRSDERNMLDDETLATNLAGIMPQLRQFVDFEAEANPARLVNNKDWTSRMSFLEFLRDVGKHVTVNHMVAKESVKARMAGDQGISYTEFSYMLIQGHDFYWLHSNEGCEMQMGGSDQWGNITLGVDLIRRKSQESALALTWPLLTKADGTKYGKTAGGETLWLDAERMSPYQFYQAWIQVEDDEVAKLLKMLTMVPVSEIEEIVAAHAEAPHKREAQKRLAAELTTIVHGAEATTSALEATAALFGGKVAGLSRMSLEMLSGEVPFTSVARAALDSETNLIDLLVLSEAVGSRSEATRMIKQNGISINDHKATPDSRVGPDDLLHEEFTVLKRGKKQVFLLAFEN